MMRACQIFCGVVLTWAAVADIPAQTVSVDALRRDLVEVGRRMYEFRLVAGTGGDVSARVGNSDQILIKQTGKSLGDLNPGTFVLLNLDGETIQGTGAPSREAMAYLRVYRRRPDVGAILHMHAPYSAALASTGTVLPLVTQQSRQFVRKIDLIPYFQVGSEAFIRAIAEKFRDPALNALLFGNHGCMVVGPDIFTALYRAETVENTARIALLAKSIGPVVEFDFQPYR